VSDAHQAQCNGSAHSAGASDADFQGVLLLQGLPVDDDLAAGLKSRG
jgi:hypothetical protein